MSYAGKIYALVLIGEGIHLVESAEGPRDAIRVLATLVGGELAAQGAIRALSAMTGVSASIASTAVALAFIPSDSPEVAAQDAKRRMFHALLAEEFPYVYQAGRWENPFGFLAAIPVYYPEQIKDRAAYNALREVFFGPPISLEEFEELAETDGAN